MRISEEVEAETHLKIRLNCSSNQIKAIAEPAAEGERLDRPPEGGRRHLEQADPVEGSELEGELVQGSEPPQQLLKLQRPVALLYAAGDVYGKAGDVPDF